MMMDGPGWLNFVDWIPGFALGLQSASVCLQLLENTCNPGCGVADSLDLHTSGHGSERGPYQWYSQDKIKLSSQVSD